LPDIIFPSVDSRVYAIDGNLGNEIWSCPLVSGDFSGSPAIADLNGDNIKDVFFATMQGEIYIGYGSYGQPNWMNHLTNSEIHCTPSAGDFDGDNVAEIAIGTENGEIFIFNGRTNKFSKIIDVNEELQKAKGSFFEDHQIRGHIAIGNLDGDNCDDLLVTTLQGNILALSGKTFKRLWHDELLSDEPFSTAGVLLPALGDLDGDKRSDVVIYTFDNKIIAYRGIGQSSSQKKILWGFIPEMSDNFIAHPVLADMNKDGYADVVTTGLYGGLYVFNGKDGKILWQQNTDSEENKAAIISTPLIADMGGDKNLDIFVRRSNSKFYSIATNARVPKSILLWNQVYQNEKNAGNFQFADLKASGTIISIIISLILIIGLVFINVYLIKRRKSYFATS